MRSKKILDHQEESYIHSRHYAYKNKRVERYPEKFERNCSEKRHKKVVSEQTLMELEESNAIERIRGR